MKMLHFEDRFLATHPSYMKPYRPETLDESLRWHYENWYDLVGHAHLTEAEYDDVLVRWVSLELTATRRPDIYAMLVRAVHMTAP